MLNAAARRVPLRGADERPFGGPPPLPFNTANDPPQDSASTGREIHDELAALPRPRRHYQWYYTTRGADDNMRNCPQWRSQLSPHLLPLQKRGLETEQTLPSEILGAGELAKLPTYYVMDLDKGMAETVASEMPSEAEIAACK